MKKFFTMAAIALFTMTSCSDDDSTAANDNGNPNPNVVLVKQLIETRDGETVTSTYSYNGNKVTSIVSSDGYRAQYSYANGFLVKEEVYDGTELTSRTTYEYNSSGKLSRDTYIEYNFTELYGMKRDYIHNSDGTISVTAFEGNDVSQTQPAGSSTVTISNGNVTKIVSFYAGVANPMTRTFVYDTKNDPFKNVFASDVLALTSGDGGGINNLLSTTSTYEFDPEYTYTYTYNQANYPLTEVEDGGTGMVTTNEYIYF